MLDLRRPDCPISDQYRESYAARSHVSASFLSLKHEVARPARTGPTVALVDDVLDLRVISDFAPRASDMLGQASLSERFAAVGGSLESATEHWSRHLLTAVAPPRTRRLLVTTVPTGSLRPCRSNRQRHQSLIVSHALTASPAMSSTVGIGSGSNGLASCRAPVRGSR